MNYDLNIWDQLGYVTEYEHEGWRITVYAIPDDGAPYGSGDFVCDLDLTLEESEMLTLGVAPEAGGHYANDPDFWLDLEGFKEVYKNIPTRVRAFLRSLENGEWEGEGNDRMLSVWQEFSTNNG